MFLVPLVVMLLVGWIADWHFEVSRVRSGQKPCSLCLEEAMGLLFFRGGFLLHFFSLQNQIHCGEISENNDFLLETQIFPWRFLVVPLVVRLREAKAQRPEAGEMGKDEAMTTSGGCLVNLWISGWFCLFLTFFISSAIVFSQICFGSKVPNTSNHCWTWKDKQELCWCKRILQMRASTRRRPALLHQKVQCEGATERTRWPSHWRQPSSWCQWTSDLWSLKHSLKKNWLNSSLKSYCATKRIFRHTPLGVWLLRRPPPAARQGSFPEDFQGLLDHFCDFYIVQNHFTFQLCSSLMNTQKG